MRRRPTVLVLRALGLGDFLTGVPALRTIGRALPLHRVVLAAPAELAPLVHLSGAVHHLLPTAELEPVRWPGPPPEVAIDLHGNGPASMMLLARVRPRRLLSFAADDGPRWRPDEHEVARWCRLVTEGLGRPAVPGPGLGGPSAALRLTAPLIPSPAPGCVVVHVGAAAPSRRWPPERFAEVVAALVDDGEHVVLTGSTGERPAARRVHDLALAGGADPALVEVTAGQYHLGRLAALVAGARLVLSGDTGVAHLASAWAVPSVVLFGPVSPAWWGPPADGPHTVLWHGDGAGDPHGLEPDPALLRITVEEVIAAAREALAATPTGPAGPGSAPRPPRQRRTARTTAG